MNRKQIHIWYEQYKVGLYRFALSILKDAASAEDALQEVFLRLLTGKYTPEPGKEQAYLYRSVRNICYDELRRRKRHKEQNGENGASEAAYAYFELISPLVSRDQEIVTLRIVGGLTNREIGKIMSMTESAVKKRYQRAIERLREE